MLQCLCCWLVIRPLKMLIILENSQFTASVIVPSLVFKKNQQQQQNAKHSGILKWPSVLAVHTSNQPGVLPVWSVLRLEVNCENPLTVTTLQMCTSKDSDPKLRHCQKIFQPVFSPCCCRLTLKRRKRLKPAETRLEETRTRAFLAPTGCRTLC